MRAPHAKEKPNLGLVEYNGLKDNNIIWSRRIHQGWIMLDTHEKDPANRYKGLNERFEAMYSPAGIHWTAGEQTVGMTEEDDYSNKSRGMRKKAAAEASAAASRCSQSWAMLIKRVYEVDPLCCPKCGGQMKVVSFIEPTQAALVCPSVVCGRHRRRGRLVFPSDERIWGCRNRGDRYAGC